jgi:hypothetical protein
MKLVEVYSRKFLHIIFIKVRNLWTQENYGKEAAAILSSGVMHDGIKICHAQCCIAEYLNFSDSAVKSDTFCTILFYFALYAIACGGGGGKEGERDSDCFIRSAASGRYILSTGMF